MAAVSEGKGLPQGVGGHVVRVEAGVYPIGECVYFVLTRKCDLLVSQFGDTEIHKRIGVGGVEVLEEVWRLHLANSTQEMCAAEGSIAAGATVGFSTKGAGGCTAAGVAADIAAKRTGNAALGPI